MNETKPFDKQSVPEELKQLPIFQVLGDNISVVAKDPKTQKTIANVFFWVLIAGLSYWFFSHIDTLLAYAAKGILFVVFAIILISLLLLAPRIITLINNAGKIILFKGEKSLVRNNPIETLQMLLQDSKDTLKRVNDKIASVDGVRINMLTDGENSKKDAQQKYEMTTRLTKEAGVLDDKAKELTTQGFLEKARDATRDANEARNNASLRKQEGQTSEQLARQYAQYANQFGKVLEILKDNKSAARIYVNALDSSITIISKKLEATNKMRSATDGLADVFNIKDTWKFTEAMDAATGAISQNIANIRSNLEFLDENKSSTVSGNATQEELEAFVNQINNGKMQTLNIAEIGDASHDLSDAEKVDKGFSLLDL